MSCTMKKVTLAAIGLTFSITIGGASAQVRPEIHPVETVTLSTQEFLLGEKNGSPTLVAGELRIPLAATGRLPAVILIHGSGGLGEYVERWAQEFNSVGVASFVLDSFSGRGITSTVDDQSQLDTLAMMVDAYRALGVLAKHPRIDASRIAVMGFSKGAVAAVYSSNDRFRKMYAPPNLQFAAHIGLYTPCNIAYHEDEKVTGKPIRLYHGLADDYVPAEPCRAYVERLKKAGLDVTLTEYPGAYHNYDNFIRKDQLQPTFLPQAQTWRHCQLMEGAQGVILNSQSGKPFDLSDPCLEKGAHLAYNDAATQATVKSVKEFLIVTFGLKPARQP